MLGQAKIIGESSKQLPGFPAAVVFRDPGTLNDRSSLRELVLRTGHEVQTISVGGLVDT
jgi:hypothetical protein